MKRSLRRHLEKKKQEKRLKFWKEFSGIDWADPKPNQHKTFQYKLRNHSGFCGCYMCKPHKHFKKPRNNAVTEVE